MQSNELGLQAPPIYRDHHLDQLYTDVDLSGFMTPASTTGFNTPFAHSRSQSADNLSSLNNVGGGEVSPSLLQARLNTMQNQHSLRPDRAQTFAPGHTPSGPSTPGRRNFRFAEDDDHSNEESPGSVGSHDYFGLTRSDSGQTPNLGHHGQRQASRASSSSRPSTRGSRQFSQPPTPTHIETVDIEALSKVPSYSTALQTPAGAAINQHLPTYQSAISRLPTPPPAVPEQSSVVHARNRNER